MYYATDGLTVKTFRTRLARDRWVHENICVRRALRAVDAKKLNRSQSGKGGKNE